MHIQKLMRDDLFPVCFYSFLFLLLYSGPLCAAEYKSNGDLIGAIEHYKVRKGDSYSSIAYTFDIGIVELFAANPSVNRHKPRIGQELIITTAHVLPKAERKGIVLNLPELRLFFFADDGSVKTFPVSIGREGWETPLGVTKVIRKRKNPVWTPPESIREENPELPDHILPGKDNPLGAYAIDLQWPGYAIHGTNRPYSVGKRLSHGCIRLYPKDIEVLFNVVKIEEQVTVVDEPYKLGWQEDNLYLEVSARLPSAEHTLSDIGQDLQKADATVNWDKVKDTVEKHSGIPTIIGTRRR